MSMRIAGRAAAAALLTLAIAFAGSPSYAENTVQGNQNSSGASASSGNSSGANNNGAAAGPNASGDRASGSHRGDNSTNYNQSGEARVGDAVAGGQIVGVVGGNATVQTTNNSDNPHARTGQGTVDNTVDGYVGAGAFADTDDATAMGDGDNNASVTQSGIVTTGDAVAGSVVVGIVGNGQHTVQSTNNATCDDTACAISGDGVVSNATDLIVGSLADTATGSLSTADQVGDNSLDLAQDAQVSTGDALFGAEVVGAVGGSATVQLNNASDCNLDVCSLSGDGFAANTAAVEAGAIAFGSDDPTASQSGDNDIEIDQNLAVSTGDALSGAQIVGGVGDGDLVIQANNSSDGDGAVSGASTGFNAVPVVQAGARADTASGDATATQNGDNAVDITQDAELTSGDAVAGGQVLSGVGYDTATVQANNDADGALSLTGPAGSGFGVMVLGTSAITPTLFNLPTNSIGLPTTAIPAAPITTSVGLAQSGAFAFTSDGDAVANQTGDSEFSADQSATTESGDAVASAQVTGLVDIGSEAVVQNSNAATGGALAASGEAVPTNFIDADTGAWAEGDNADAQQVGSNDAAFNQKLDGSTGDGVAGSQVTGVVGGNADVTVQTNNTCEAGEGACANARSGDAYVFLGPSTLNTLFFNTGANSSADPGDATTSQAGGDNTSFASQELNFSTGDAVAGSQVGGVVTRGDVTLQANNDSVEAISVSGSAGDDLQELFNQIDGYTGAGANAEGDATVTAATDDVLSFDQTLDISSGDAVAGSQIHGVAGSDSATVQISGTDDESQSFSGDTAGLNLAGGNTGAYAETNTGTSSATQSGDAESAGDQTLATVTGDAVAGGQITGLV